MIEIIGLIVLYFFLNTSLFVVVYILDKHQTLF